jgi:hypothetical protein
VRERIEVDVSEPLRQSALEDVRGAVTEIRQGIGSGCFERKGPQSGACKRCDFRRFCPGYDEWQARNPSSPTPPLPEQEREMELEELMEDGRARS